MINSGEPTSNSASSSPALSSPGASAAGASAADTGAGRQEAFSSLMNRLGPDAAAPDGGADRQASGHADLETLPVQELRARLGVATSLFLALRAKHAATAAHSLRVALGVSSWLQTMNAASEDRDVIEIAALLHDIGKIGVADYILEKPGKLTSEEALVMDRHRRIGRTILAGCSNSAELIDMVENASVWYDTSAGPSDQPVRLLEAAETSSARDSRRVLGSRMIAIVDAYDSMTTDRVYRPAMSVERATAELFACAGTQFDPELVHDFCELLERGRVNLDASHARQWLEELSPAASNSLWCWNSTTTDDHRPAAGSMPFNAQLLQNMHDGVIFVDAQLRILLWNRAAERLTGVSETSVQLKHWSPALLELCDDTGRLLNERECPVAQALHSGVQTIRRLIIRGGNDKQIAIDAHVAPVLASDATISGVTLVIHDASTQITLEERVQVLYEKATRDPLTKVANRAEFDRLLPLFVDAHKEQGVTCSMIMCDIDHFKRINDTYGHQAGDEALVLFAESLQRHARAGDLVARYGGEEFALLCAHCDNVTATRRANEARTALASQPLPPLDNKCLTASFGVTEVQAGDTPETFLRRADRALMQAKDNGRNLVVQLGTGAADAEPLKPKYTLFSWLSGPPNANLLEHRLVTVMPLKITAEKLRGFVADHGAEVINIEDNRVLLLIDGHNTPLLRRWNDRAVPLVIEITLRACRQPSEGRPKATSQRTAINVAVRLKRQRDRRRHDAAERARQLVLSLKSYLMAHEFVDQGDVVTSDETTPAEELAQNANEVLSHWLDP